MAGLESAIVCVGWEVILVIGNKKIFKGLGVCTIPVKITFNPCSAKPIFGGGDGRRRS